MKKSICSLLAGLMLVLCFAGVSSGESKVTIGFASSSLTAEFHRTIGDELKARAEAAGYGYIETDGKDEYSGPKSPSIRSIGKHESGI